MISNKPIVQHIEDFLDYCDVEKGLRNNTQKNYKGYLNKFVEWLKYKKLEGLLPHQLTHSQIEEYRLYLSCNIDPKTGLSLKVVTQHYYLIALRALLGYFIAKDIVSLPPGKIALPRADKSVKIANFINLGQIKHLLGAPDIEKNIGLRDRIILEVLIGSGLKMSRLVALNIDDYIYSINTNKNILLLIEKYLNTRKDKNKALFINYSGPENADKRLTVRSIERTISQYGKKINLPFLITPESLRWSYHSALAKQDVEINNPPKEHKSFLVQQYRDVGRLNKIKNSVKEDNFVAQWNAIEDKIKTVSLYKLWHNLASMKDIDILVVPSENKILEFKN